MDLKLRYKTNTGEFTMFDNNSITNRQLLGMLIFGEARGSSDIFKFNVAVSALARLAKAEAHPSVFGYFGTTLKEVITKKYQYSCFLENDPNMVKLQDLYKYESDEIVNKCFALASSIYDMFCPVSKASDILMFMPTHYETMNKNPKWAEKLTYLYKIENGEFYREG